MTHRTARTPIVTDTTPEGDDIAHYNRAFGIGIALNVSFIIAEYALGTWANSLALLADASHNLSDVLGLLAAWGAALLAQRPPSMRFSYGFRSSSILAALANAILLLLVSGGLAWEGTQRLVNPQPTHGTTVILVAVLGVAINGTTALMFRQRGRRDINIRGAFLHMAADAAVSLGVVVAGVGMNLTGWTWIDPAVSLLLVVIIATGTWGLLREALELALHAAPRGIDVAEVHQYLARLPGVRDVHDLHIWGMSTRDNALTAHVVMPGGHPGDQFLRDISMAIEDRFQVHHATIQVELGNAPEECGLRPNHVV